MNDSELSVEEGQLVTVCVNILSPKTVDRTARLVARTLPLTAIGKTCL